MACVTAFASGCFVPCVPDIAKDLNTTGTIIKYVSQSHPLRCLTPRLCSYTVGAYIFMVAVGNLVWAPYAGFCSSDFSSNLCSHSHLLFFSRWPSAYIPRLPPTRLSRILGRRPRKRRHTARDGSHHPSSWRFMVRLPTNAARSLIHDNPTASCPSALPRFPIYTDWKNAEQPWVCFLVYVPPMYAHAHAGTESVRFFQFVLFGPTLAPVVGGLMATYASWRAMQMFIFSMGLVAFIFVALFLPETSHPGTRGIDLLHAREVSEGLGSSPLKTKRWRMVWINPFKSLVMLRGPVILFVVSIRCVLPVGKMTVL